MCQNNQSHSHPSSLLPIVPRTAAALPLCTATEILTYDQLSWDNDVKQFYWSTWVSHELPAVSQPTLNNCKASREQLHNSVPSQNAIHKPSKFLLDTMPYIVYLHSWNVLLLIKPPPPPPHSASCMSLFIYESVYAVIDAGKHHQCELQHLC